MIWQEIALNKEKMAIMESHLRTIAKSLTWRFTALTITTVTALIVLGNAKEAMAIGIIDTMIKLVVYYGHERIWIKISFGRKITPEYEI